MPQLINIKGYNSFVDAENHAQELEIKLSVFVKAHEFASVTDQFLNDLQKFLDERK